jgi:hypothetical protein
VDVVFLGMERKMGGTQMSEALWRYLTISWIAMSEELGTSNQRFKASIQASRTRLLGKEERYSYGASTT